MKKNTVGSIVKLFRVNQGLTQNELAEGICSVQHIYRIENSKRLPSAFLIKQLSLKLGNEFIIKIYDTSTKWI